MNISVSDDDDLEALEIARDLLDRAACDLDGAWERIARAWAFGLIDDATNEAIERANVAAIEALNRLTIAITETENENNEKS